MKLRHLLLGLAASTIPTGLAAQDDEAAAPPAPPQIMMRSTALPIAGYDLEFAEYHRSCGKEEASIPFGSGQFSRAVFLTDGYGPARLVMCDDEFEMGIPTDLVTIDVALAFMAYKPFEPFWKAAEERWGDDLGKLRAELRGQIFAMTSEGNSYQGMIEASTARAINKAHAFGRLGYYAEAQEQLDDVLERLVPQSAGTDDYNFDLELVAIAAAGIQTRRVGPLAASNLLESFGRTGVDGEDTINLDINRAAYLAESGRYREALDLLLPAYEAFREGEIEEGNYRISGSNREFSWILACAYVGLDDSRRASPFIAIVETADESPTDPFLENTKRSTDIRFRMSLCMDDQDGYFAVWRSIVEPFLSYNWLGFQKAGGEAWIGGVGRDWIATHRNARNIAREYRQLPDRYTPALHRWQAITGRNAPNRAIEP